MIEYKLSDYLNAINFSKVNLLDGDDLTWEKKFPPYVINRCLSQHIDTIIQANEMNPQFYQSQQDLKILSLRELCCLAEFSKFVF